MDKCHIGMSKLFDIVDSFHCRKLTNFIIDFSLNVQVHKYKLLVHDCLMEMGESNSGIGIRAYSNFNNTSIALR